MRISYLEGEGNGPSPFKPRELNSDLLTLEMPGASDNCITYYLIALSQQMMLLLLLLSRISHVRLRATP